MRVVETMLMSLPPVERQRLERPLPRATGAFVYLRRGGTSPINRAFAFRGRLS